MADEQETNLALDGDHDDHEVDPSDGAATDCAGAGDAPEDTDGEPETEELEEEFDEEPPAAADEPRLLLSAFNAERIGTLVLHFSARDVSLVVDGDAGLRFLEIYRKRGSRTAVARFADRFDPAFSSAANCWIVTDPRSAELLAASWIPGVPSLPSRVAIDPIIEP